MSVVDEETFELAQKRIATATARQKQRRLIFFRLLFCAGCRHKMYYQQGVNIEPRKFLFLRRMARQGKDRQRVYLSLYRKNVLLDLVLEDMRRVLRYVTGTRTGLYL